MFDLRGNLKPAKVIEISLPEFEENFVKKFIKSKTRKVIFENYLLYVNDFKQIISNEFYQLINGGFITKKTNPRDVDIVTFISYNTFNKKKKELEKFKKPEVKNIYDIDAYIVIVYPKNHSKFNFTKSDKLYWQHQFGKTRKTRAGKRFRKGIIKIIF